MTKRKVDVVLICEDSQQESFVRRFLYGMGWGKKQLRVLKSKAAKGSGEQWVREKYVQELAIYRKRHVKYAFIAIVDGNSIGMEARLLQFETRCLELDIPKRGAKEQAAIICPTRNIETWICYLMGNDVDEKSLYPKLRFESDCKPAVDRLIRYCQGAGLPENAPSSLKSACQEFQERIQN